jgi:hypothetical protein
MIISHEEFYNILIYMLERTDLDDVMYEPLMTLIDVTKTKF